MIFLNYTQQTTEVEGPITNMYELQMILTTELDNLNYFQHTTTKEAGPIAIWVMLLESKSTMKVQGIYGSDKKWMTSASDSNNGMGKPKELKQVCGMGKPHLHVGN